MQLLEEVLETLKFRHAMAQKVDGQISDLMAPNMKIVEAEMEKERTASRKLDYSAVMATGEEWKCDPSEPTALINLFAKHGVKDNKKVKPQTENKFY